MNRSVWQRILNSTYTRHFSNKNNNSVTTPARHFWLLGPTAGFTRTFSSSSSIYHGDRSHTKIPPPAQLDSNTQRRRIGYMGDNIVNFYSGQPPLNRLSFHRNETAKMSDHLKREDTLFVLFKEGKPLMSKPNTSGNSTEDNLASTLKFLTQSQVAPYLPESARTFAPLPASTFDSISSAVQPNPDVTTTKPASEPDKEGHMDEKARKDLERRYQSARLPSTLPTLVFLGVDDREVGELKAEERQDGHDEHGARNPKGVAYFALECEGNLATPEAEEAEFTEPRLAGSVLGGWEANLFAQARALMDWNNRYRFCPGCGSPTYSLWCGWKRGCGSVVGEGRDGYGVGEKVCPSTKGLHNYAYPRTDPVIIMGILDPTGEKMLMGRQKAWPKGMYSCLAGFIEPGESIEDAVRREVMEEAGVKVGQVRYSSCQPWPFPANLMIGCYGLVASDTDSIALDLDNELEDAQWFSKDSVLEVLSHPDGTNITRKEHQKLEPKQQLNTAAGVQEGAALAPAEGQLEHATTEMSSDTKPKPVFRFPPKTAIAGVLIDRWAKGEMNEVSVAVKNRL